MKLSLCITTFERDTEMVNASFKYVLDDNRISEVVLLDDFSQDGSFERLQRRWKGHNKVKVAQQPVQNVGMSRNKAAAVSLASNPWCILFDSDNSLDRRYLDALYSIPETFEEESEIYMPQRAMPNFKYDEFQGESIHRNNIIEISAKKMFGALLNTSNYVVNKKFYADCYQSNPDVKGADTIWHAYNHLKNFGSFYVVPGMFYEHKVWEGSTFAKDMQYNLDHAAKIEKMILALQYPKNGNV